MTLDLSKAKVGDKVKHRNGGVSVVDEIDTGGIGPNVNASGAWFHNNGGYSARGTCGLDIVELLPQEDELAKASKYFAQGILDAIYGDTVGKQERLVREVFDFAKAIVRAAKS